MTTSLTSEFCARAQREPERPFCIHDSAGSSVAISHGNLLASARAIASQVVARGDRRGDVALLFVKHEPAIYAAFVGCMLAGVAPSFMPYPNPKQDRALFWRSHRELLRRIEPRLIVVSASLLLDFSDNLPEFAGRLSSLDEWLAAAAPDGQEFVVHDPALLQHSSGTTATKKGVMLSHAEVLGQVDAYARAIALTDRDVIASWLPLYHDMGLIACFMLALIRGALLVALDPFEWVSNPGSLLEAIERHRATLCWLPNFAFNHLAASVRRGRRFDLSSVRAFINCSEPCKPSSFETFRARFEESGVHSAQLQVCYAMAENVFAVTQTPIGAPPRVLDADSEALQTLGHATPGSSAKLLSCGPPIEGVEVRVVDDGGVELGERRVGEIAVRSPFVFSGYYRLPEKTERALRGGWYFTGDLGFVESGELFVTGRKDDLLIAYGRNYYAHDIEAVANTIQGLIPGRNVAFAIVSDAAGTQQIVLAAETMTPHDHALVRRARETVLAASGLALTDVFLCEPGWLIKTTSGKIARGANLERYLECKRHGDR